jgi:hypothetical protein
MLQGAKSEVQGAPDMKILVVGSGGREHALCWTIATSPLCDALYCAPGNAGIADEATCIAIAATNIDGIVEFARSKEIDFVVVGPEDPLVAGLNPLGQTPPPPRWKARKALPRNSADDMLFQLPPSNVLIRWSRR